jgi:hypothetical protein
MHIPFVSLLRIAYFSIRITKCNQYTHYGWGFYLLFTFFFFTFHFSSWRGKDLLLEV